MELGVRTCQISQGGHFCFQITHILSLQYVLVNIGMYVILVWLINKEGKGYWLFMEIDVPVKSLKDASSAFISPISFPGKMFYHLEACIHYLCDWSLNEERDIGFSWVLVYLSNPLRMPALLSYHPYPSLAKCFNIGHRHVFTTCVIDQ